MRMLTCLLFSCLAAAALAGEESKAQMMRVGAAAVDITPKPGTPMAGYYRFRAVEGVRDPLYAKAIVIEHDGSLAALAKDAGPSSLHREHDPRIRGAPYLARRALNPLRFRRHVDEARDLGAVGGKRAAIDGALERPARLAAAIEPHEDVADRLLPERVLVAWG